MNPIRLRFEALRRLIAFALTAVLLLTATTAFGAVHPAVAPVAPGELSAAEKQLAVDIKSEAIREVVTALSADDMQGRGTAQPGGDKAANYLAERFAKLNLKPLGVKNSFLQPIKFRESEFMPETSFKIGEQPLKMGPDFVV